MITWCNHPECEQYGHSNCQLQGTEDADHGPVAVSDPDEKLMEQVQKVSAPSLAQLYKMGRARGLIQAQRGYQ